MKRSHFSEEWIVGVLKEAETGVPIKDLCRRILVGDSRFDPNSISKSLLPGMPVAFPKRLVAGGHVG